MPSTDKKKIELLLACAPISELSHSISTMGNNSTRCNVYGKFVSNIRTLPSMTLLSSKCEHKNFGL